MLGAEGLLPEGEGLRQGFFGIAIVPGLMERAALKV